MLGWLPENISTYGHRIDDVIRLIYYIVGVWFILAEAVLIYFVIRYRRKKGGTAAYQPGTRMKALAWILVPAVLVLGFDLAIDMIQGPVWNDIKLYMPGQIDQTVKINGRQFVWDFTHPGRDGKLGTKDDIVEMNHMTIPVNSTIRFELGSTDVLHSFWVPHLRLKQDAVPGRVIEGWFEATKTGDYPIACAELCGSGHGIMRGQLHVLSRSDYVKWLDENTPSEENEDGSI